MASSLLTDIWTETKPGPTRATESADEVVYQQIYTAIVDHRLPPGTRLVEDTLADIFSVSRPRVRNVLQRLSHENIVTLQRNRGAIVSAPTAQEAKEVFAARSLIEERLVSDACATVTRSQIRELGQLIRQGREAGRHGRHHENIKFSGHFHLKIAEAAGNATLERFLRELLSRTSLIIAVHARPGSSCCHHDDHDELLALLEARDAEGAAAAMARHLKTIESDLALDRPSAESIDLRQVFSDIAPKTSGGTRPRS